MAEPALRRLSIGKKLTRRLGPLHWRVNFGMNSAGGTTMSVTETAAPKIAA